MFSVPTNGRASLGLRMKPRIYVETSVIGYLTAWLSRDVVVLGRQQTTREWWQKAPEQFEMVTSDFVIQEASMGDAVAVGERLAMLRGLPRLAVTEQAYELAGKLLQPGPLPAKAKMDAAHIAVAVIHGVPYLITWNFKHIANPAMRADIDRICRDAGYDPVTLCSPNELMGNPDEQLFN